MRYAVARYQKDQRDMAYRIYVSDCLRMINKNLGEYPARRFIEIMESKPETRSGEEIFADVINNAGLEVVE